MRKFFRLGMRFFNTKNPKEIKDLLTGILRDKGKDLDRISKVQDINGQVLIHLKLTRDFREIKQILQEELSKQDFSFEIKIEDFEISKNEQDLQGVKNIIFVSSCKGGVGKSTMAYQLSMKAQKMGLKVGLFDADFYGPSLPTILNKNGVMAEAYEQDNQKAIPINHEGVKAMSFGFVSPKEKSLLKGPIVSSLILHLIKNTLWGDLDVLFVDTPPGTGDINIKLAQDLKNSGTVLVTTPHDLSIRDVIKGMDLYQELNIPILGIVENMSIFSCPCCSEKTSIFGKSKLAQIKSQFGLDISIQIPIFEEENLAKQNDFYQGNNFEEFVYKLLRESEKQKISKFTYTQKYDQDSNKITITRQNDKVNETRIIYPRELRINCRCALCIDEISNKKLILEKDIPIEI